MLVYASEFAEEEQSIDSEYDTLVSQNQTIIEQNTQIIAELETIDNSLGIIFATFIIVIGFSLGKEIINAFFGNK